MSRRLVRSTDEEELNIFQAFTDLMSNAFMIMSFLLLISLLQSISIAKKLESASPIIIDEKSGNFKFPSGSAELTPDLQKYIQNTILPEIIKATAKGNIDFIQIIGHTDSQGVSNASNLDNKLTAAATGTERINNLKAGSNTDLGLMRAVAVVQFLNTKGLNKVRFRAYSAGQLYLPSGELAKIDRDADDTRRRIEIRFIPYGQKK
ncbi:OmpA family protein [Chamaesiphon minutus]|uniref:Outer membrane protein/peptidoglycan-associated (Lipo)protein n=1 Tax=Chamaesiphon minutus (strain ATCC 27169 / PCC 6605) TaxID=1173020 RepID=K9UA03_CHAP6|nr:OmpA family protein [Chamaesiphon minutus]AFY91438.1 outer membrane protein/peptidoglycan-associated (lipo)protein [Chamaesiphon minutus PCC 6605]